MRDALPLLLLPIVAAFTSACQSNAPQNADTPETAPTSSKETAETPIAYLDGKPVTQTQVYRRLASAHGGDALAEILLDRAVAARLQEQAITLTPDEINAERDKLLAALDPDPDQAARLLKVMRSEHGLDEKNFNTTLRRNAGLRRLVRDQIRISDAAIQQAYTLRHGDRFQARLIIADRLDVITRVRLDALAGQSFTELAIEHSTDISASQGGLLSPISPADPTYPKAIRDALPKLTLQDTASRLSSPIALDGGYALLWLEEVLPPDDPPTLEAVRDELQASVRSELERIRMRQLARTLNEQADVVILDPTLHKAWQRQTDSNPTP